MVAFKQLSSFN